MIPGPVINNLLVVADGLIVLAEPAIADGQKIVGMLQSNRFRLRALNYNLLPDIFGLLEILYGFEHLALIGVHKSYVVVFFANPEDGLG